MADHTGTFEHSTAYNILQFENKFAHDYAPRFPEVRGAVYALRAVEGFPHPPSDGVPGQLTGMDMLDWLGAFFGFQADNVRNQREHVILLLANYQMRMQEEGEGGDRLDPSAVHLLRKKLLKNYKKWCFFLRKKPNLWLPKNSKTLDHHRELLYSCLYLLIWGEAANLRFMPECLCFIFHHMAMELNNIIEVHRDDPEYVPNSHGKSGFLAKVIVPIYNAVKGEADVARAGKAPHSVWRNYDDMNEYFWSKRCFAQLSWPLNLSCNYLVTPMRRNWKWVASSKQQQKVGKTGFVEQRSFWNIFRSFDHLWTGLILLLQVMMILAFNGNGIPWHVLYDRDVQGALLSVFITWAGLRFLQAVLDVGMQYSLISRETKLVGVRMVLKMLVALGWTIVFSVLLVLVWQQRYADRSWSHAANQRLFQFLETAGVFILPEILAIILFLLPWIRIFIEKSEWRVFHVLTWWFETRLFVARGLREGVVDNLRYMAFWLVALTSKFAFSYFLQVRPLVEPTRQLLSFNAVAFAWHEFFSNHNRFIVVALWTPVILIYMMDLQIWYCIFSSLVGGLVGLSCHIGEIRNVEQFKLRFPFFASAMAFNLMAPGGLYGERPSPRHHLVTYFRDMLRRVMLRYGLVKAYKKYEKSSLESKKFAYLWNRIILFLREEDLLNDNEVQLLQVPDFAWNLRVMQWPAVLLSNEVLIALGVAQGWEGTNDKELWEKLSKNEYRRSAILECYDSAKNLLLRILRDDSQEHIIVESVFKEIEMDLDLGVFVQNYRLNALPEVHSRLLALVEIIRQKPAADDLQPMVDALQNFYEVMLRDFPVQEHHAVAIIRGAGLATVCKELLFLDVVELPDPEDETFFRGLERLYTILSTRDTMRDVPQNLDARRRISFFSNSLFMNMPHAPSVEKMLAFSVLTPYLAEDVMYTKEQLRTPNEDGITILFYLQSIYPDEWRNFVQRIECLDSYDPEAECWDDKERARQLRLWASHRGQTLARTVRGMMYYQQALETLSFLDVVSEAELSHQPVGLREARSRSFQLDFSLCRRSNDFWPNAGMGRMSEGNFIAGLKFTYVLACEIYGAHKAKKDSRADDISFLLKSYPALRVAYVDEVSMGTDVMYYSVLVKYDPLLGKEVEIYRIQLPGPLELGEGKPENQNHALIFTRGDAVQAIDMNQDNYFEEALKVRNLLQEFTKCCGLRRPQILGMREHVLTGSVSSLAWFMSAQETSFVTLGQRVLACPLKIRMHYGHPDMFDRLWFLTRGGIGKASQVINVSEDIFAGYNCISRAGNVTHNEYIQVGKAKDVGLNQIALYEAKVSSGNGEQMLSRDVYRLGHRLDFFRMLSFYYTTVGLYVSNMVMVLAVYAFLWGRVYSALSGVEDQIERRLNSRALLASINQEFIVQIGLFTALPMIVEDTLELGFSRAVWDFLTMQLELSSVFFAFSLGTKCHYFGRTLLHGGAKYRATGRGFVVKRDKFVDSYRLYSRSHFVKGVELIVLLLIYAAYGSASNRGVYIFLTFSSWFLALSWIMAPFLFNPTGFDWLQTVYDFEDFQMWLWYKGGVLARPDQSWEAWWNAEEDHLRTTNFWGKLLEVVLSVRFFLIQYGMVYRLHISNNNKSILVYFVSWIYIVCAMGIYMLLEYAGEKHAAKNHLLYRGIQLLVTLFLVAVLILLSELTSFYISDLLLSFLAFLPTGWGMLSICLVLKPILVNTMAWPLVVAIARFYDFAIGIVVMIPLAVLSWLPGFQAMQTRLLFNQAFSRGLQISRMLAAKKPM